MRRGVLLETTENGGNENQASPILPPVKPRLMGKIITRVINPRVIPVKAGIRLPIISTLTGYYLHTTCRYAMLDAWQ